MRFGGNTDWNLVQHFNNELLVDFVDINVVLYKINITDSVKNSYDESTSKTWYSGVSIACLLSRQKNTVIKDMTLNIEQDAEFHFLRSMCVDRNVFPEIGDIIVYDNLFFEISALNDLQKWLGQVGRNVSIVATAHMTRTTTLNLLPPVV